MRFSSGYEERESRHSPPASPIGHARPRREQRATTAKPFAGWTAVFVVCTSSLADHPADLSPDERPDVLQMAQQRLPMRPDHASPFERRRAAFNQPRSNLIQRAAASPVSTRAFTVVKKPVRLLEPASHGHARRTAAAADPRADGHHRRAGRSAARDGQCLDPRAQKFCQMHRTVEIRARQNAGELLPPP